MLGVVALGGLVVFGILGYNFMVFVEAPATLENAKEEHLKKQKAINMRSAGIKLSQEGTLVGWLIRLTISKLRIVLIS
jgi:hypothetical protein